MATTIVNVLSNAAYLAAAALIALQAGPHAFANAAGLCLLGAGSSAFHALENERWARSADEIGMYVALSVLQWTALDPAIPDDLLDVRWLMLVQSGLLIAVHRRISSFLWIPILIVATLVPALIWGHRIPAVIAAGLIAIAAGIRFWDEAHSDRRGGGIWHGIGWHPISAVAFLVAYAAIASIPISEFFR